MISLKSDVQVARAKRNAGICALYAEVRKANPDTSKNRALIAIAKEFNVSPMTVKGVLRAANQYD